MSNSNRRSVTEILAEAALAYATKGWPMLAVVRWLESRIEEWFAATDPPEAEGSR
jgi:hypothetical protein